MLIIAHQPVLCRQIGRKTTLKDSGRVWVEVVAQLAECSFHIPVSAVRIQQSFLMNTFTVSC